jgi:prevent-host-death family protein
MPKSANNSEPLTAFKRDTARIAARLKRTGKPLVLTVNGEPAMVVQDAVAYQRLLDQLAAAERADLRAALEAARADVDAGRTVPAIEFLKSLGRENGLAE